MVQRTDLAEERAQLDARLVGQVDQVGRFSQITGAVRRPAVHLGARVSSPGTADLTFFRQDALPAMPSGSGHGHRPAFRYGSIWPATVW